MLISTSWRLKCPKLRCPAPTHRLPNGTHISHAAVQPSPSPAAAGGNGPESASGGRPFPRLFRRRRVVITAGGFLQMEKVDLKRKRRGEKKAKLLLLSGAGEAYCGRRRWKCIVECSAIILSKISARLFAFSARVLLRRLKKIKDCCLSQVRK